MRVKLSCCPEPPLRASNRSQTTWMASGWLAGLVLMICGWTMPASAFGDAEAPSWMHAVVSAALPEHDEKTEVVLLYAETNTTVLSADKVRTVERRVFKILRPEGRSAGYAFANFDLHSKVVSLHGWCIPASGKDYAVGDKDAQEASPSGIDGGELSDSKIKFIRIPAADVGNIVGFESIVEGNPLVLQDSWHFQKEFPVREWHYSLQLPPSWEYKTSWVNYTEVKPMMSGGDSGQWVVNNVKALRPEAEMPPFPGIAGSLVISFFPPGGAGDHGFSNWSQMGDWYRALTAGRYEASPEIKQEAATLAPGAATPLDKMRNVAHFMQSEVRYIAIEFGIGGFQPHSASDIFAHRYGDCKDKATLMMSLLREMGIESYYVIINSERGAARPDSGAYLGSFNHAILAIKLPAGVSDPSLMATIDHPKLGKILFFDPTNQLTPFGQIGGYLQANYGLLVTPNGGDLVELPMLPTTTNSVRRTAKLKLDSSGKLQGDVNELRVGDRANEQRYALQHISKNLDQIKPIEHILADSLSSFYITKATLLNVKEVDRPFGFDYSFVSDGYAKVAGDLILVRPRVLGRKTSAVLETSEPRLFPVEFAGPAKDVDLFEITLPAGYEVDELPSPVDSDFGFASYHSKTEAAGNVITYSRTFEVKELSVPVAKMADLKKFYRIIASDERNSAVLRPITK